MTEIKIRPYDCWVCVVEHGGLGRVMCGMFQGTAAQLLGKCNITSRSFSRCIFLFVKAPKREMNIQ